jgi:hypothetical protein
VTQLAADSGALTSVRGQGSGAGYRELALAFERGTLRIECDVDSDEVVVSVDAALEELPEIHEQALSGLFGKVIQQAWTMTNDRGFDDGFQLRCIDLDTRVEACAQFEAAAGVLLVAQVTPLWRHS